MLQKLDLAGVKRLRSADLAGLVSENLDDGQPALEVLTLDNTDIDDDAAPFLTVCTSLRTLGLSGTKVTSAPARFRLRGSGVLTGQSS